MTLKSCIKTWHVLMFGKGFLDNYLSSHKCTNIEMNQMQHIWNITSQAIYRTWRAERSYISPNLNENCWSFFGICLYPHIPYSPYFNCTWSYTCTENLNRLWHRYLIIIRKRRHTHAGLTLHDRIDLCIINEFYFLLSLIDIAGPRERFGIYNQAREMSIVILHHRKGC